jgi:hypothetical protein
MSNFSCPFDTSNCTIATCALECAQVQYLPTLGGNLAYIALLAVILVAQVFLGVLYRTWGFLVGMVCGLILEIIGYAGRVMIHHNPFDFNSYLL